MFVTKANVKNCDVTEHSFRPSQRLSMCLVIVWLEAGSLLFCASSVVAAWVRCDLEDRSG